MTRRNNARKRAARDRSRADGVSYTVARRWEAEQTGPSVSREIFGPRSVDDLLHEAVESWCAQQMGEPITEQLWLDPELTAVLGVEIDEPTVHELTADRHMTYSSPIEEHEGGTLVSTVTSLVRLTVDGLMERGAAARATPRLVDVLDWEWNEHFVAVLARTEVEVELEFAATTNPDYETVDHVEFVSATVLVREQR